MKSRSTREITGGQEGKDEVVEGRLDSEQMVATRRWSYS